MNNIIQHMGRVGWELLSIANERSRPSFMPSNAFLIGGLTIAAYLAYHFLKGSAQNSLRLSKEELISNEELTCVAPNIHADCDFNDYREPNEGTPINVQPHLEKMEPGYIASVGTERSFVNLALSNEKICTGLITVDINSKAKAYCDFLVLLLRVSRSRIEFVELSKMSLEILKEILVDRIHQSDMSKKMKSYYIDNFDDLGSCYLPLRHLPEGGDNSETDYRLHDELFNKLQRYARAGQIITRVGDIRELGFADWRKISVIDVSNIPDYCFTKFEGLGSFTPRIIHTIPKLHWTDYFSGIYKRPSEAIITRMDQNAALIKEDSARNFRKIVSAVWALEGDGRIRKFDTLPETCYSKENNEAFERALQNDVIRAKFSDVLRNSTKEMSDERELDDKAKTA